MFLQAHCVSTWGHDFRRAAAAHALTAEPYAVQFARARCTCSSGLWFPVRMMPIAASRRPDYRSLGDLQKRYVGVPIMALTATATPAVKADIQSCLFRAAGPQRPPAVFQTSFYRSNLHLRVCAKTRGAEAALVKYLAALPTDGSGIVYCISKRNCTEIASLLCENGLSAVPYHAGLGQKKRQQAQMAWQQGAVAERAATSVARDRLAAHPRTAGLRGVRLRLFRSAWSNATNHVSGQAQIVVATIAFGMGIDKPNVRCVVHWGVPGSAQGYFQEIGRAGAHIFEHFARISLAVGATPNGRAPNRAGPMSGKRGDQLHMNVSTNPTTAL